MITSKKVLAGLLAVACSATAWADGAGAWSGFGNGDARTAKEKAADLLKKSGADTATTASKTTTATTTGGTYQSWMSSEVADAWAKGYKGQNVTIKVIDDFSNTSKFSGNLGTGTLTQGHGYWTKLEASMIAPLATIATQDYSTGKTVTLNKGLNVLNLSYAMYAKSGYSASQISWSNEEKSIISYAQNGSAIISKAAGNDAVAVGAANASGNVDYLNSALKGTKSAIYVGALSSNGSTASQASMASYSNVAGADATIQKQFLVVGVSGSTTGLYGTSFAAPIISGYAAVIGSKFTSATSTQITNQLLNTARQDTVKNYSAAVYGRGEASLTRALAPVSIK